MYVYIYIYIWSVGIWGVAPRIKYIQTWISPGYMYLKKAALVCHCHVCQYIILDFKKGSLFGHFTALLLMEEILHQLIGSLSH